MYINYFCALVLTYTESENGAENAIKLKRFCSVFQRLFMLSVTFTPVQRLLNCLVVSIRSLSLLLLAEI